MSQTPTVAPEPMLAREFDLEINTGTRDNPVWTHISGIMAINPGQTSTVTDDTDFDTDGWEAGTVAMRGRSLSVSMLYKTVNGTGAQDPGQEALIVLGETSGRSAKGGFRYLDPDGNGHEFRATVDVAWPGGGKTDNANFTADLKVDGKPTPVAPAGS